MNLANLFSKDDNTKVIMTIVFWIYALWEKPLWADWSDFLVEYIYINIIKELRRERWHDVRVYNQISGQARCFCYCWLWCEYMSIRGGRYYCSCTIWDTWPHKHIYSVDHVIYPIVALMQSVHHPFSSSHLILIIKQSNCGPPFVYSYIMMRVI